MSSSQIDRYILWVNRTLLDANKNYTISSIIDGKVRDGTVFVDILEYLSGKQIVGLVKSLNNRCNVHNLQVVLDQIIKLEIPMSLVRASDLERGNTQSIIRVLLGLIKYYKPHLVRRHNHNTGTHNTTNDCPRQRLALMPVNCLSVTKNSSNCSSHKLTFNYQPQPQPQHPIKRSPPSSTNHRTSSHFSRFHNPSPPPSRSDLGATEQSQNIQHHQHPDSLGVNVGRSDERSESQVSTCSLVSVVTGQQVQQGDTASSPVNSLPESLPRDIKDIHSKLHELKYLLSKSTSHTTSSLCCDCTHKSSQTDHNDADIIRQKDSFINYQQDQLRFLRSENMRKARLLEERLSRDISSEMCELRSILSSGSLAQIADQRSLSDSDSAMLARVVGLLETVTAHPQPQSAPSVAVVSPLLSVSTTHTAVHNTKLIYCINNTRDKYLINLPYKPEDVTLGVIKKHLRHHLMSHAGGRRRAEIGGCTPEEDDDDGADDSNAARTAKSLQGTPWSQLYRFMFQYSVVSADSKVELLNDEDPAPLVGDKISLLVQSRGSTNHSAEALPLGPSHWSPAVQVLASPPQRAFSYSTKQSPSQTSPQQTSSQTRGRHHTSSPGIQ